MYRVRLISVHLEDYVDKMNVKIFNISLYLRHQDCSLEPQGYKAVVLYGMLMMESTF